MYLTAVLAILTAISFGLTIWRWRAGLVFPLHRRQAPPPSLPGITLVKPLKGCDAATGDCLRSWMRLEYPGPVQVLFGVADADDPVCAVVRQLLAESPTADASLVICDQSLGVNPKVSTLRQLEPHIRHDIVMISDADVKVPADFAANVTPQLSDPAVGLVNCFYRLANPSTAAMQWEAVAMNADFWTQVLQRRGLRPVDFALGAVMTLSRARLSEMGGFAVLSDFLADDYQLGRQIVIQKKEIAFATLVAECWDPPLGWRQVWAHQSRWAHTIRVCQPVPFFFSILNNASLWPLLLALLGRTAPALGAAAVCLAFRIGSALQQQSKMNQTRGLLRFWWWPPLKDVLDAIIWVAAFAGTQIVWRGDRYRLLPGGKLSKVQPRLPLQDCGCGECWNKGGNPPFGS
ncbi:MAG: glycosyltransferase [Limisphaerales bacterium]